MTDDRSDPGVERSGLAPDDPPWRPGELRLPGSVGGFTRDFRVALECIALDEKRPADALAALAALGEIDRLRAEVERWFSQAKTENGKFLGELGRRARHAEDRVARTADRRDECPHDEAQVEAYVGTPGADDPADRGLPWEVLAPEQRDLDGMRVTVTLGVCERCSSRVVTVRTWDGETWTPEHGPAWSSPYARLIRDGGR